MIHDKYTYPGTEGVLVNHLGIRDADLLDTAINELASIRWAGLLRQTPPQEFTFETLRAIHERLFREILPFAGELRDVDTQADRSGIVYCRPDYIPAALDAAFAKLRRHSYLAGLDAPTFADGLADHWGELSAIHPFRDGNTRSQCAYVSALAESAGHPIRWSAVDVDRLRALRLAAVAGHDKPLASYVESVLGLSTNPPERLVFTRRITRKPEGGWGIG